MSSDIECSGSSLPIIEDVSTNCLTSVSSNPESSGSQLLPIPKEVYTNFLNSANSNPAVIGSSGSQLPILEDVSTYCWAHVSSNSEVIRSSGSQLQIAEDISTNCWAHVSLNSDVTGSSGSQLPIPKEVYTDFFNNSNSNNAIPIKIPKEVYTNFLNSANLNPAVIGSQLPILEDVSIYCWAHVSSNTVVTGSIESQLPIPEDVSTNCSAHISLNFEVTGSSGSQLPKECSETIGPKIRVNKYFGRLLKFFNKKTSILSTPMSMINSNNRPTQIAATSISNNNNNKTNQLPSSKTTPKGYCVIFNHAKFKNPELNRAGTEYDEKALLKVFKQFNIKCKVRADFTLTQIEKQMEDLTKKDFSKYACLIIVILSHGRENEQLYSHDEIYVLNPVITEPVFKIKSLANKPKLFFIQACKGSNLSLVHKGVPQTDSIEIRSTRAETKLIKFYSTYEDRVSYRYSDYGSIFIQKFCKYLDEYGKTEHIVDIMQAVIDDITTTEHFAQVPCYTSTMTAHFYFKSLSFKESKIKINK